VVAAQIYPFTARKQGRQKAKERTAPAAPFFSLPLLDIFLFLFVFLPGDLSSLVIFFCSRWPCTW
jgi:hypothetical protein